MVTWEDLHNRRTYKLPNLVVGRQYTLSTSDKMWVDNTKVHGGRVIFTANTNNELRSLKEDTSSVKLENWSNNNPTWSPAWEDLPDSMKPAYYYEVVGNIFKEIKSPLSALDGETRNLLRNNQIEWVRHTTWMSGTWEEVYNKWK